jgi:hypothetical protein
LTEYVRPLGAVGPGKVSEEWQAESAAIASKIEVIAEARNAGKSLSMAAAEPLISSGQTPDVVI